MNAAAWENETSASVSFPAHEKRRRQAADWIKTNEEWIKANWMHEVWFNEWRRALKRQSFSQKAADSELIPKFRIIQRADFFHSFLLQLLLVEKTKYAGRRMRVKAAWKESKLGIVLIPPTELKRVFESRQLNEN